MKLQSIFLFIALICIVNGVGAQSLTVRDIEGGQTKRVIKKTTYDTLSNIKYHKDPDDYKMYIGQDIMFYPRSKESDIDVFYYDNFLIPSPDTLYNFQPDTVWIRKRKKVRARDYKLKPYVSVTYKPEYVVKEKVCSGNLDTYTISKGNIRTGFYTPYRKIEGNTFKIIDCKINEQLYYSPRIIFTLVDSERDTLLWYNKKLLNDDYSFPAIIVSYYEKVKNDYVGKSFFPETIDRGSSLNTLFLENIKKGGKYTELTSELKCIDLSLIGGKYSYLVPKLIFEDANGELLAMDITLFPYLDYLQGFDLSENKKRNELGYSISGDVFTDGKEHSGYVAKLNNLTPSEVIYKQRREKEEKRLAEERQDKEKKEKREREIRAKYKSKEIVKLILSGYVRTGMTKQMCIDSWGTPSDINTSTGIWGTHEQWVYGRGSYLYFENGILTSIQN